MTVFEGIGAGIELAKPIYGTLRKVYHSKDDKAQFCALLREAVRYGGLTEEEAGQVSAAIGDQMNDALRDSAGRWRKATWGVRLDRGPGIDRMTTDNLCEWLDILYRQAVRDRDPADVPATIGGSFLAVLNEEGRASFAEAPTPRAVYAWYLVTTLERNNREFQHHFLGATAVTSGLATTGVAAAFADGANGNVDLDLKTALLVSLGITLIALISTLVRTLDRRPPSGQPVASSVVTAGPAYLPTEPGLVRPDTGATGS